MHAYICEWLHLLAVLEEGDQSADRAVKILLNKIVQVESHILISTDEGEILIRCTVCVTGNEPLAH